MFFVIYYIYTFFILKQFAYLHSYVFFLLRSESKMFRVISDIWTPTPLFRSGGLIFS